MTTQQQSKKRRRRGEQKLPYNLQLPITIPSNPPFPPYPSNTPWFSSTPSSSIATLLIRSSSLSSKPTPPSSACRTRPYQNTMSSPSTTTLNTRWRSQPLKKPSPPVAAGKRVSEREAQRAIILMRLTGEPRALFFVSLFVCIEGGGGD